MPLSVQLLLGSVWNLASSALGLIFFFGAAAVQMLWLWSTHETKEKMRWTLLILSGAVALVCPVLSFWMKELIVAFLAAGAFPYAVILFSGARAGTILSQFRTKKRPS